ncbi:hypothetical protein IOD16_23450 [Saccharothrix sp. 6-C]|uniref:hypothetical protein n=1 Tax=Saccharothrix sp. 6-C TaxID=2781735 RepID=UPI0019170E77|nr:hypothetical protein [Saccharothrix sp. 6-C]QQQ74168.1 hypothetical protein IOD16_23450 [Saccharothrix sp. 6-C]
MFARGTGRALLMTGLVVAAALAGSTQAGASPYGGFTATCSSAADANERFWTNMSWDTFRSKDAGYFADGLRITQLDIEGHDVTATWQPGSGTQRVHWGLSTDQLESLDATYFSQGLRLVDLDYDGDWAAVWRPGSGAQHWRSGIPSWTDFKNQNQVYFDQGLRLVDVVVNADDDITGVWRADQGTAGQVWQSGLLGSGVDANNESQFDRVNRARKESGWELQIVRTHPHDSYVMGVWRYRGGSFQQSTNLYQTTEALANMRIHCQERGMRLVSVDVK